MLRAFKGEFALPIAFAWDSHPAQPRPHIEDALASL
jgi:hypothetical protein